MKTKKLFISAVGFAFFASNLFLGSAHGAEKEKDGKPWKELAQESREPGKGFEFHLFPIIRNLFPTSTPTTTPPRTTNGTTTQPGAAPRATTTPGTTTPPTATSTATTTPRIEIPPTIVETTTPTKPGTANVLQSVIRVLNFIDPTSATTTGNKYDFGHLGTTTTRALHGISLGLLLLGALIAIQHGMKKRWLIYSLVAAGIILATSVAFINSLTKEIPIEFSPTRTLDNLWTDYKKNYIESTGRTLDPSRENITTSEGQAYTMLRAVWSDDKETFDKSWKWTKDNLRRKNDAGISWLFGKNSKGYGVIEESGGLNSASDADTDLALALIFAHARWKEPIYQGDAYVLLGQIWNNDIVMVKGKPYLTASDSEKKSTGPIAINPSYLFPAAYRIFAEFDAKHDWRALIDTSYEILNRSTDEALGEAKSAGLPPDWIVMDRKTGALKPGPDKQMTTNYSFDAFRVPWRIALDAIWHNEPRAETYLTKLGFLKKEWEEKGMLYSVYDHDGSVVSTIESPASYGANLGYFMVADPENAKEIYEKKLLFLYNPDTRTWKNPLSYYDENWAWFGIALYNSLLPNLTKH